MRAVPPYSLPATEFPFRALARLAGRAALGGSREQIFAILLTARLVDGVVGEHPIPTPLRRTRASAAKSWLSALALPASNRTIIARLVEATAGDNLVAVSEAWDAACRLVAPVLDAPALGELRRVTNAVAAAQ